MARKTITDVQREIQADPVRRERAEREKAAIRGAMKLAQIREKRAETQAALADMLGTTQANISRIERTDNLYLRTLAEYVAGLGGRLEISAVFDDEVLPVASIESGDREKEPA